ncbi:UTRA domain-containing protein [Aliiroseovarius sp. 2305UL8-7]|uniref:UTRA domain-containing protein n=1 Tax=Aliiroseovarius conchicola TaxID=3121637 RepID=UPI0035274056
MRTSYQDIKAEVMNRIRQNIWPPGAIVPGEIDLAKEFGCARATVNRAMRELVAEGVLERKRKAGTRVKSSPTRRAEFAIPLIREEIAELGAAYRYVLVDRNVEPAPVWLRAKLDVPTGADMLHIRCMHFADSQPYQYEDRWINLAAVPHARDEPFEEMGPNEWLIRQVPYTDGQLRFSAIEATDEVAEYLDMPKGRSVFMVERTTWLEGQSVTFARMHFPQGYSMTTRF